MKKTYQAPKMLNHGSVSEITAFTGGVNRTDILFGTDGQPTGTTGHGSLDGCLIQQGPPTSNTRCVVN